MEIKTNPAKYNKINTCLTSKIEVNEALTKYTEDPHEYVLYISKPTIPTIDVPYGDIFTDTELNRMTAIRYELQTGRRDYI